MIGSEIKELRVKARIPQGQLAQEAGMPQWMLCRIEKGQRHLQSEEAAQLVAALHRILADYALVGVGE